ncbi:MAG: DUF2834 domain-containing protein [Halocynthiibacter sp.]
MSKLRLTYLLLTVVGTVWPLMALWSWNGGNILEAWLATAPSRMLLRDLLVASFAFTVWVISETLVRRNWLALWALVATVLVGLSCGLPLYLFLRSRPIS